MTFIPPSNTASAVIATEEGTASTTYSDLGTVGPSVTVTIGPSGTAVIWMSAVTERIAPNNTARISVSLSGANTIAASDTNAATSSNLNQGAGTGALLAACTTRCLTLTGLTPGSTTFKLQYRCDGGTSYSFYNRSLIVTAL